MTGGHTSWDQVKRARKDTPAVQAGYESARRAFKLGEQVRRLREERGISQAELARRMGTGQPAIARLEAGGVTPTIDTLERVGRALGVELKVDFVAPIAAPA